MICVNDCPAEAIDIIRVSETEKKFKMILHNDRCIHCAQCVDSCPTKTYRDERRFRAGRLQPPRPEDRIQIGPIPFSRLTPKSNKNSVGKKAGRKVIPAEWQDRLRRWLRGCRRLLVLGVGQRLKGDDGVGVYVARLLQRRVRQRGSAKLAIIAAGETPENYTARIRRLQPSHVLIVDAAALGRAPGAMGIVAWRHIANEDISTHRLPLSLLARFLEQTLPCKVLLLAIEPKSFSLPQRLSAEVKKSALQLARFLADVGQGNKMQCSRGKFPTSSV